MKIGIITFHASNNCGSMLQAYGLQKTLDSLGYANEIINFSNRSQRHMYALLRKPGNIHDTLYDLAVLRYFKIFKAHYYDYKQFLKNHLRLGVKEYYRQEEMVETNFEYDLFIAGSDQVWNILCPDADDAYYLNFVYDSKKKIAYAPSFGATSIKESSKHVDRYKDFLVCFDHISIRENNGAKWIKELIGKDVPVLLDPTMLLEKIDYLNLLKEEKKLEEKYIFYYAFNYSDEVNFIVQTIGNKLNLPIYILDVKNWVKKGRKYGFILSKQSGPITFLNLLLNAELVLTTSFHGSVFSILGEKKFWFIDSSMHNKNDDRAETLLNMFGLENRFMKKCQEIDKMNASEIMQDWDYEGVLNILQYQRNKAKIFLLDSIEN